MDHWEGLIKPLNCNSDDMSTEWQLWKEQFLTWLEIKEVRPSSRKLSYLRLLGGMELQKICGNLQVGVGDEEEFDNMLAKLDGFFVQPKSRRCERFLFRKITQKEGEKFDVFLLRLRKQATKCGWTLWAHNENIGDQIVAGCRSDKLRSRVMEKDIELDEIVSLARSIESVEMQKSLFHSNAEPKNMIPTPVSNVTVKKSRYWKDTECFKCGGKGHVASSENCPAISRTCNNCGKRGHFAVKCRAKKDYANNRQENGSGESAAKKRKIVDKKWRGVVNELKEDDSEDEGGILGVFHLAGMDKIECVIGGAKIVMIIDSGAAVNVIAENDWKYLSGNDVVVLELSWNPKKKIMGYGSEKPLELLLGFRAKITVGNKATEAIFYVVKKGQTSLLGNETAKALGVLRVGLIEENIGQISKMRPFGKLKGFKVKLIIDEKVPPVFQPYRRVPISLEEKVEKRIQEMLDKGIIERVTGYSRWASPLVVVPKKDGDIRVCVDLRRPNTAILYENVPFMTTEELMPKLRGAEVFSKIDGKDSYHQVELDEDSREVTTFIFKGGLYRYTRLPFGLKNAASDFQNVVIQMLAGLEGVISVMDDIIVFGPDRKVHDERLKKVLKRLQDYDFVLNEKKCEFGMEELDFLGWRISKKGFKPTEEKFEAIKNFRCPVNQEEVRSFLGLVNFIGSCIPNLATMTAPLRELLKKEVKFRWTDQEKMAFENLKKALRSDVVLCFFNPRAESMLMVDASPVGLGAILLQKEITGWKMVGCAAKSLTDTERKYYQLEREALGIVFGVERFRYFLAGRKFQLYTDCKPLEFMFSPKSKPCARIERWVLRVQSFDFKIAHKPGSQNIADCLSRLLSDTGNIPMDESCECSLGHIVEGSRPVAMSLDDIREEGNSDCDFVKIKEALKSGSWVEVNPSFSSCRSELCLVEGILLKNHKIVIPKSLRARTLKLAHESHQGVVAMKARLRSKVWWPGIDKDVEDWIKHCKGCILVSLPGKPEPICPTKFPDEPWEAIAIDFKGPLPSGESLLVVIDYFSKFAVVEVMNSVTAGVLIKRLRKIFGLFGPPRSLRCDNGPQMNSEEFKKFGEEWGVALIFTTPYWPQANGEVERFNRTLGKHLSISRNNGSDWKEDLNSFLLAHHATPHPSTGKSPAELMFKRKMREKIPAMSLGYDGEDVVKEKAEEIKRKMKNYVDNKRKAKPSEIMLGDDVVLLNPNKRHKLDSNFASEEYKVIQKDGGEILVKSKEDGKVKRRQVAHAKKVIGWEMDKHTLLGSEHGTEADVGESSSSSGESKQQASEAVVTSDEVGEARPKRKTRKPLRFGD